MNNVKKEKKMSEKKQNSDFEIYCYLRVSTEKQDIKTNRSNVLYKVDELGLNNNKITWIEEVVSGVKCSDYRKLGEIQFKKGDYFITTEVSRIGRKMVDILNFITKLVEIGVHIHFSNSNLKLDDSINSQVILFALALSSQIERELISQRTKQALQYKKEQGVYIGRPKDKMVLDDKKDLVQQKLNEGVMMSKICEDLGCSRTTLCRLIKKHNLKKYERTK